jgi:hypothetical protein
MFGMPLLTGRPPRGFPTQQAQPQKPPPQNKLADQAQKAMDAARKNLQQSEKALSNKSGMVKLVVETARIICSETNPARHQNTLLVPEARSLVEGRKLAQVQDVQRDKHIKPWTCECKKRPKPGGGYLPCDYKPQGMWKPGVHTETNDQKNPQRRSQAEEAGRKAGQAQAQAGVNNIANSPQTMNALQNAAQQTGQSFNDLATKAIIESTGNAGVGTNPYGYTGLMQMGRAAASDVGMSYGSLVGAGNVGNNALAGAKYMNLNAARLPAGIPKDGFHLYMAHQQGAGGTAQLMRTLANNPGAALTPNQANQLDLGRVLGRNPTQQDFYDYFKGKYKAAEEAVEKKFGPPKTMQAVPEVAVHRCTYGGTIRIVDPGQHTKKAKLGGASIKP